jgi:hypothetical protein
MKDMSLRRRLLAWRRDRDLPPLRSRAMARHRACRVVRDEDRVGGPRRALDRVRFPDEFPSSDEFRRFFVDVRAYTLSKLSEVDPEELGRTIDIPDAPTHTLRSWLWFTLEHELHHHPS